MVISRRSVQPRANAKARRKFNSMAKLRVRVRDTVLLRFELESELGLELGLALGLVLGLG